MSLIVVSNDVNVPYITDKHTRIPKKKKTGCSKTQDTNM